MKYEQPVLISMNGSYPYAKGACVSGSGNVETGPTGLWAGTLVFTNTCQSGGGNTGAPGALGACLNGSAHSNAGLGALSSGINPNAGFCETGSGVTSSSGSSYCVTGSVGIPGSNGSDGCLPGGNPPPRNCYSGSSPT